MLELSSTLSQVILFMSLLSQFVSSVSQESNQDQV